MPQTQRQSVFPGEVRASGTAGPRGSRTRSGQGPDTRSGLQTSPRALGPGRTWGQCLWGRRGCAQWGGPRARCSADTLPGHRVRPSPGAAPSPGHRRHGPLPPFTGRGAGWNPKCAPQRLSPPLGPQPTWIPREMEPLCLWFMTLSPSKCDVQTPVDVGVSRSPALCLSCTSPPGDRE